MKLYTEEQVREAIRNTRYFTSVDSENDIINNMTPISLPSDEEIEEEAPYVPKNAHDYYVGHKDGFIEGAKWVIDKIKNQQ